jgi:hypothetical protein
METNIGIPSEERKNAWMLRSLPEDRAAFLPIRPVQPQT